MLNNKKKTKNYVEGGNWRRKCMIYEFTGDILQPPFVVAHFCQPTYKKPAKIPTIFMEDVSHIECKFNNPLEIWQQQKTGKEMTNVKFSRAVILSFALDFYVCWLCVSCW